MKVPMAKSSLNSEVKVEVTGRHALVDAFRLGSVVGSAIPAGGAVQGFVNNFRQHVKGHLESSNVYVVFDRCVHVLM